MPRVSASRSLIAENRTPALHAPASAASREPLWLAVCFPQLALHAVVPRDAVEPDRPAAVYQVVGGQLRIVAANTAARRVGVTPAVTLSTALALAGDLALYERAEDAEATCLEALADRAGRFTPKVSLEPREGLLLEIRASLKLFGGLDHLRRRLVCEWQQQGLEFHTGIAATPLAALWLARHRDAAVTERSPAARLGRLPLGVTGWPEATQRRLREMGVRTIGECLRLPRDGFARRLGQARLDELDRAMGRRPDPRLCYEQPDRLVSVIDFPQETIDRADITAALESAIGTIALALRQRQAQTREIRIGLHYSHGVSEVVGLDFVGPLHAAEHLLAPILVRLDTLRLAGAVTAIRVETGTLAPVRIDIEPMFADPATRRASAESGAVLIECLRSRFGRDGVYGLGLRPEHRPEFAFRRLIGNLLHRSAAEKTSSSSRSTRPLWILPVPVRLSRDTLKTMSRLESDPLPERIESGWWDDADVRRDYYVAMTAAGECWWVYRDRMTQQWHLHGVFG